MAYKSKRWSLAPRILGLAMLNLLLIGFVLAIFAQWMFGLNIESIALGPSRARISAIANDVQGSLDLEPRTQWSGVLAKYAEKHEVDLFLVGPEGRVSLTGVHVQLPEKLLKRMGGSSSKGYGRPGERRGPPFGDDQRHGPPQITDSGFVPRGGFPAVEKSFFVVTRAPLSYWVGVRIPVNGPNGEKGRPAVLLLRTHSILNRTLFFEWRSLMWLGLALAAVALLCWLPFVHGVTRSIHEMAGATEEIAQGRFGTKVSLQRQDELGHLGEQINRMALRLEGFVKHQKRFLGDIAHELCAPIARIQFAFGILEQKASEVEEPHLAVLRDEIQEMSSLVNELLMFAKAGMQPSDTPLVSVGLDPVVRNAVSHQLPGTGAIQVSIPPEITVVAYEPYLLRAISNLLRNALRYAGASGPILIAARREANRVLLTVTDCGPGLPEEAIEDVFAPFYRPELARSPDTGGAGLGLAIVKSCIEACHGTVACRNREPSGLEVTISLAASKG
ncbi:MAG: HAMP domain-containing histidine kinase [Acidobacteria bacterium]|nr:HAMP domain-containing histidine kinase [Acidobacteriota bacterium]